MKILIIGLPDAVSTANVTHATAALVDLLGLKDMNIRAKILNESDLAPEIKIDKSKKSKFVTAIEGVMKVVPLEANESTSFRSWFYSKVLDGTIARPILEIISLGPTSNTDAIFLRNSLYPQLPEYATVALNMLALV